MRREVWYDVTEYECWMHQSSRRWKSPIALLSFLTNAEIDSPNARKFFDWPVFLTWNYVKFRLNLPILIVWCIWRVGITLTGYFVSPVLFPPNRQPKGNTTDNCNDMSEASLTFSIFLVVYATLVIALDVVEWFQYLRRDHLDLREVFQYKDYATHNGLYRFVAFMTSQLKNTNICIMLQAIQILN